MADIQVDTPLGKTVHKIWASCMDLTVPMDAHIRQSIIALCDALERTHERAERNESCFQALKYWIEDLSPDESLVDAFYSTMESYGDMQLAIDKLRREGVEIPKMDAWREHRRERRELREAREENERLAEERDDAVADAERVRKSLDRCLRAMTKFDVTNYDDYGGPHLSEGITKLGVERNALRAALSDVLGDDPVSICTRVHHAKKDQHPGSWECPVADRYLKLIRSGGEEKK